MTSEPHDDELRRALRDLRSANERAAPSFDAVMARRRMEPRRVWRPSPLAFAAGVVLVAGGVLTYQAARPKRLVVPDEVLALSTWRPMTDVLLQTTNLTLLRDVPRLGDSVLP